MSQPVNCKYCESAVEDLTAEGLKCDKCGEHVHVNCLKRGSVPGGLVGDVFFSYVCRECNNESVEKFSRDRMPWFQALVLMLYHISVKTPGLARRGYFHWKMHLGTLIDQHWDVLFATDFKRKKKWIGTISGTLSHYSPHFFHSGTPIFGEQGWWMLTFPKLTPNVQMKTYAEYMVKKVKLKDSFNTLTDLELIKEIIESKGFDDMYVQTVQEQAIPLVIAQASDPKEIRKEIKMSKTDKINRKSLLPTLETITEGNPKKFLKTSSGLKQAQQDISRCITAKEDTKEKCGNTDVNPCETLLLNPMCHYNTSLSNISHLKGMDIKSKLLGGLREETVLSPYSSLYLKPYIRRDVSSTPDWLKLMAEVLAKANQKVKNYLLPPRSSIDYVYVQPSHIPAINSLCNMFFWPGIDLTECLQYPDFSCVVLYKKLIVGFAFVVPDVNFHENYVSFMFVRPGWRNSGIGKFMMYHLIQTSTGKDLTLHVSINNPALILYQKFGFKVEHVDQNFYDKYYRRDRIESKHAFFCRLER